MIIRTLLTAAIACSGLLLASSENSSILQGSTGRAADEAATADTADQADTTQQQTTGEQQENVSAADVKDALEPFNALVGDWRGTGQVRRGSNRGAWREKTSVAWSFEKQPAILVKANGGLHYETLHITSDGDQLIARQKRKDREIVYRGPQPEAWPGKVELLSQPDSDGVTYRCTLQQLSDIRATILLEKRTTPTGSFRRIAGVGYTRSGQRLAQVGGTSRKCIVTGGLGTIAVSHKGKTYYVCCQGCLQAFNDAPEEIIAEYKASLQQATSPQ